MTAKTKHGHKAHPPAHGADPGTPHERLNRLHAMPGRAEGAMHGMEPAESPGIGTTEPPQMPPPPGGAAQSPMAPPGAGPDDEEGEQT